MFKFPYIFDQNSFRAVQQSITDKDRQTDKATSRAETRHMHQKGLVKLLCFQKF